MNITSALTRSSHTLSLPRDYFFFLTHFLSRSQHYTPPSHSTATSHPPVIVSALQPQDTERAYSATAQEVKNLVADMVRVLGLQVVLVEHPSRVTNSTLRKQLTAPRTVNEIQADAHEPILQPMWTTQLA